MAFKILNRNANAIRLGKGKNEIVGISGFLVGAEIGVGKFKSCIFHLLQPDKSIVKVWGGASIDANFLTPQGNAVDPLVKQKMVRLTFLGQRKLKGRRQPMRDIRVEVDASKTLKAERSADYMVPTKRSKK